MSSELSHDRGVQKLVRHFGFRPELFSVPGGSYASNSSYGGGVAQNATYLANQVDSGNFNFVNSGNNRVLSAKTTCDIRKEDKLVDFALNITLDSTTTAPSIGEEGGELRIRVLPRNANEPGRYAQFLPEPDRHYDLPLLTDVEILIVDASGAWLNAYPLANSRLAARLLDSQVLALVAINYAVSPPPEQALTAANFNTLLGQPANSGPIMLIVRGNYRAAY